MKYVCFGYYDKGKFDGMSEAERNAMFDTCLNTTTIFAPTGTGVVVKRFRVPKPP